MNEVTQSEPVAPEKDRQKLEKPVARSLMAFLENGEARAAQYIALIEDKKIGAPTDEELDAAHDKLAEKPDLLSKVAELARAAAESKLPRVANPLLSWCANVLRSWDNSLENWAKLAGGNPSVELRQLGIRLQKADKEKRQEAELLLNIGIVILVQRFDLDPVEALAELAGLRGLEDTPATRRIDAKRIQKLLIKSRGQPLDNLISVAGLFMSDLANARSKANQSGETVVDLRERLQLSRQKVEECAATILQLQAETARLQANLDDLKGTIVGVQGGADHAMIEIKARYRRLLTQGIGAYLANAQEALSVEPPALGVVRSRVDLVRSKIGEELAWLNESLD